MSIISIAQLYQACFLLFWAKQLLILWCDVDVLLLNQDAHQYYYASDQWERRGGEGCSRNDDDHREFQPLSLHWLSVHKGVAPCFSFNWLLYVYRLVGPYPPDEPNLSDGLLPLYCICSASYWFCCSAQVFTLLHSSVTAASGSSMSQ